MFTNCGNGKQLQKKAPASFQEVYYSKNDNNSIDFHLSVTALNPNTTLENIYFKGLKSPLTLSNKQHNTFVAHFNSGKTDFVMSADPKEEYGNKIPQKPVKSPVNLEDGQALLEYTEAGETYYFVLNNIEVRK